MIKSITISLFMIVPTLLLTACPTNEPNQPSSQAQSLQGSLDTSPNDTAAKQTVCDNKILMKSIAAKQSNVQMLGCGTVLKVLPDDNKGSRHQKMIVQLHDSQYSVLIAHNIDLAPRVSDLKKGDVIDFYGEYEYTEKGGVVHWTHHDPAGRHQGGYIIKNGQKFE